MKGKAMLLIGAAAGYVLGAQAGRERYEQIKSTAGQLWGNPKVQEARRTATEQVKDKVEQGVHDAKDRLGGSSESADQPDLHPVGGQPNV